MLWNYTVLLDAAIWQNEAGGLQSLLHPVRFCDGGQDKGRTQTVLAPREICGRADASTVCFALRRRKISVPSDTQRRKSLPIVVLGDLHFWIPVAVLVGGLAVLRWMS